MAPEEEGEQDATDLPLLRRLRFLRAFSRAILLAAFLLALSPWVFMLPSLTHWAADASWYAPYAAGVFVFAAYGIMQVPSGDHKHPRTLLVLFWALVGALVLHGLQSFLQADRFLFHGRMLLVLAASYGLRFRAVTLDPSCSRRSLVDLTLGYLTVLVVLFLITYLGAALA